MEITTWIERSLNQPLNHTGAHELMGKLRLQTGDTAGAVDSYTQSVELYNATGNYSYAKPIEEWLESRE